MKASPLSAEKDAAFDGCAALAVCEKDNVFHLFVAKFGSCIMDLP